MRNLCRTLRDHLAGLEPGKAAAPQEPELRDHLTSCPQCQAQWAAHKALGQALGGLVVPRPQREKEVLGRLQGGPAASGAGESLPPRPALAWPGRLILAGYWLAAAALSAWLLAAPLSEAAAWVAARPELTALVAVPLCTLLIVALPLLQGGLRRLFISLAATPGRTSR